MAASRFLFMALLAIFVFTASVVHAERLRPASAREAKAAYCQTVLKEQKKGSGSLHFLEPSADLTIEKENDDQIKKKIDRVNSWLNPRLQYIDADSIVQAGAQGKRDLDDLEESSLYNTCKSRCKKTPDDLDFCMLTCFGSDDLFKRVNDCNVLDFIPY